MYLRVNNNTQKRNKGLGLPVQTFDPPNKSASINIHVYRSFVHVIVNINYKTNDRFSSRICTVANDYKLIRELDNKDYKSHKNR